MGGAVCKVSFKSNPTGGFRLGWGFDSFAQNWISTPSHETRNSFDAHREGLREDVKNIQRGGGCIFFFAPSRFNRINKFSILQSLHFAVEWLNFEAFFTMLYERFKFVPLSFSTHVVIFYEEQY